MSIPVAILVRVSTVKQETARQIHELQSHAAAMGWEVVAVCEEMVSGRADESERHGLRAVEELAQAGKIRKVLVHEVSRLARRNSIVHRFVETLEELNVSLYWHSQGVETLLDSGKRNPSTSMMLALLAEMARNETETLRTRILSGLEEAKRKGVTLGRPTGTTKDATATHKDVVRLLAEGHSIRHTAKITGKSTATVQAVRNAVKKVSGVS